MILTISAAEHSENDVYVRKHALSLTFRISEGYGVELQHEWRLNKLCAVGTHPSRFQSKGYIHRPCPALSTVHSKGTRTQVCEGFSLPLDRNGVQ